MKITPEGLISAINEYCHLPEKKKKLTTEQIACFSDPENVFFMIFLTITAPAELSSQINENIYPWIETAISELKKTVEQLPAKAKVQIEEVIEEILRHAHENAMLNQQWLTLTLTTLKKNRFVIKTNFNELIAVNPAEHSVTERPELKTIIKQTGIDSAVEFIDLFEENLTLIPSDALPLVFSELAPYSWGLDALLLLTQYHSPEVALASTQTLDQYPAEKWSQLSNQQLLNLCARFNQHPAIKTYFKKWQKHAMRYCKSSETAEIKELYLTHIDGNNCSTAMMSIIINGQENQFSLLLDLSSGLRETLVKVKPESSIPELIKQINEQQDSMQVDFVETSPASLASILPWILAIHQEKNAPFELHSLYFLSQLPFAWPQPEPFNLEKWAEKLDYQKDEERVKDSRLSHTIGNSLMMTWQAPSESILAAKKPKDLLKLYYYRNKDLFAQRLTYAAIIQKHQIKSDYTCSDHYLDLALALYDPNINRKKFNLFESLAEISYEEFTLRQYDEPQENGPQGLVVKIMLQDAKPAVWRHVHLSNQLTLDEMHDLIQITMGWEDDHLYQFFAKENAIPEEHYQQLKVASLLKEPGDEIMYRYDFGDDWHHIIRLEKTLKNDIYQPKVTAGNGLCPAEDSGGIWNWNHLLKLRKKAKLTEEELEALEWVGLSPDESLVTFEKVAANELLKEYF